uniref:Uncharacterized protein n=1 Tax=Cannabis sativa TaxID=3483 RepID=A0A803Q7C7_CANSA
MEEVITKRRVSDDLETGLDDEAMEEIVRAFEKWAEEEAKNTFHKDASEKEQAEGSKQVTLKVKEFAPRVLKEVRTTRCKTTKTPFVATPSSLREAEFQNVEELTVNGKDCQLILSSPDQLAHDPGEGLCAWSHRVSKESDFRNLYFLVKDIGSKHTKFHWVN